MPRDARVIGAREATVNEGGEGREDEEDKEEEEEEEEDEGGGWQ